MSDNSILHFESLDRALKTLDQAISAYTHNPDKDGYIRDACIQRFEYCYDLAIKLIRRYLTLISGSHDDIKSSSFQSLIREAYRMGLLLNSWDKWREYRDKRNITSHGYDEAKAIDIADNLGVFSCEIHFLLDKLNEAKL